MSQILFKENTVTRMTTTKQHDLMNRLTSISSAPSAASVLSFGYSYNDANQRTRVNLADASFWLYEYDKLGQLKSAKKYWPDWTPVAGQQFEYGFDDIGNRTSTKAGGDNVGQGLRPASYSANSLNQYTTRDVPGYMDVLGLELATNSVTVNSQSTYRKAEYFRKELPIDNSSAAKWTNITVSAPNETTVTGNLFVPKTPENFGYDADGNMTNDGRWVFTWDAENRLIQVESLSSAPTASKRKVVWEFDDKGRRIRQTTYDGSSGSYIVIEDLKFLSDGWRHIAELNATNNALIHSYPWGLDLSGSLGDAGGVGGLLMLNSAANGVHFFAYDGNGNVAALVKGTDGTNSANYEYGSFGEPLRRTGSMAEENQFRFSTKRAGNATDQLLYENRVYGSAIGRWSNRDPIDELGFINLDIATECPKGKLNPYAFVVNDPLDEYDYLGLDEVWCGCRCGPEVAIAVRATLYNVYGAYYASPEGMRTKACRNLHKVYFGGQSADSWDITSLVNWTWMKPRDPCYKQCDSTVTYKAKCFYANQVNYVLYGYASQLCGFSYQGTYNWMKKWLRRRKPNSGDTTQSIAQKLEFVTEGYYIDLMRSLKQHDTPPCLPSKRWVKVSHPRQNGTFDATDWIWEPIQSRTD